MANEFELSSSEEMDRRKGAEEEFFRALIDPDEWPYFVSDEATLRDLLVADDAEVIDRCEAYYSVRLRVSDFTIPFWRLLDELEAKRRSRP